jgi:hypothetical protein
MNPVPGLTASPSQQQTIVLPDGTKLLMQLEYNQLQQGWFFLELDWNSGQWVENGRRIVNHGNMLRQYKNILDFGLACFTVGNREPTQLQDFSSQNSVMYVLTAAEVLAYEAFLEQQKNA